MKLNPVTKKAPTCLMAVALMALGAATAAQAAAPPALQGQIALRPLTPTEQSAYKLTSLEKASGLSTVPIGQPVYLEALVNSAIPAADITGVTWAITTQPIGSAATLTNSPLGTNVPIYHPADAQISQIAGRSMLIPDVRGQYVLTATITTAKEGTTNVTQTITAGTYMGVGTCELCHSGGLIAPSIYEKWTNTLHASKFTRGINGVIDHYSKNCISCHVVGYDTSPLAVNGGFDDIASQLGWTFPTVLTNGNFQALDPKLKNLANIQCENCHGPGSEHAYNLGDTSKISVSFNAGNCGQCHDAKSHHIKNPEWMASKHAITTSYPTGPGHEECVGCHSGIGFANRMKGATTTNTTYAAISCATCHDPHDATNPHQLRSVGPVTLHDGTVVSTAGKGELCMNCHQARVNASTYVDSTPASPYFGPHHGPQSDMLMGVNGYTYGQTIASSAHGTAVEDSCVHCHMQDATTNAAALYRAGGHTFNVRAAASGTNAAVEMTAACTECHGSVTTLNFPRQDYNGDGVVEGVQTEVQHLLDKLSSLLPPVGTVKTSLTITTNWTRQQLRAGYNFRFVNEDGSRGIHNLAYAVGLLKASIADLSGDANNDGIPDAWQIQYFGSISNPNAAPSANPAGDGIPNWLKYSLGLDPTKAGQAMPGGVVLANGNTLVSSGGQTNAIQIYTAAEIAFNTQAGKTYQLQSISSLGGGWQNVGTPITGTGSSMSYVTPTRAGVQQYFRVLSQ